MKTLLVPTDFSETSKNAVLYAFGFAKQVGAKKIVLYNAYPIQLDVSSDLVLPTGTVVDYAAEQEFAEKKLLYFADSFAYTVPVGIKMEIIAKCESLVGSINGGVEEIAADAIVMGITGGGKFSEKIIGSNTTTVAKFAKVPVIIVPPGATFSHIIRILLASDFEDVELSTPFAPIISLVNATNAQLLVLHVAKKEKELIDASHPETITFVDWLPGIHPSFHFIQDSDFVGAVNTFATENKVGLIIIVPKKHDLAEKLFIGSHTKKIGFSYRFTCCSHQQ